MLRWLKERKERRKRKRKTTKTDDMSSLEEHFYEEIPDILPDVVEDDNGENTTVGITCEENNKSILSVLLEFSDVSTYRNKKLRLLEETERSPKMTVYENALPFYLTDEEGYIQTRYGGNAFVGTDPTFNKTPVALVDQEYQSSDEDYIVMGSDFGTVSEIDNQFHANPETEFLDTYCTSLFRSELKEPRCFQADDPANQRNVISTKDLTGEFCYSSKSERLLIDKRTERQGTEKSARINQRRCSGNKVLAELIHSNYERQMLSVF